MTGRRRTPAVDQCPRSLHLGKLTPVEFEMIHTAADAA